MVSNIHWLQFDCAFELYTNKFLKMSFSHRYNKRFAKYDLIHKTGSEIFQLIWF